MCEKGKATVDMFQQLESIATSSDSLTPIVHFTESIG